MRMLTTDPTAPNLDILTQAALPLTSSASLPADAVRDGAEAWVLAQQQLKRLVNLLYIFGHN